MFGASEGKRGNSVLLADGEAEYGSISIANLLLLFRTSSIESSKDRKYGFFQYLQITLLIDIVDEMLLWTFYAEAPLTKWVTA